MNNDNDIDWTPPFQWYTHDEDGQLQRDGWGRVDDTGKFVDVTKITAADVGRDADSS